MFPTQRLPVRRATRSRGHWTWVTIMFVLVSSNGRLLSSPQDNILRAREEIGRFASDRQTQMQRLVERIRSRGAQEGAEQQQPAFVGAWKTARTENFDAFLEHAMGVGYLKRSIAARATQQQSLSLTGKVIQLEITDRRGTMSYQIYPDDKVHASKGFMKLPIKQRAKWARDGSLLVEERYSQHLGGDEHGKPCKGDSCPIVKSRRSVDKSGDMVVEIERTLLSGETIRMKTYYQAVPS